MSWDREVDELKRRQDLAAQMGGPDGIERQHGRGKLTARERIHTLGDPDTFREFMGLAGVGEYRDNELTHFTPKHAHPSG